MLRIIPQRGLHMYDRKEPAASKEIVLPDNIRQVSIPLTDERGHVCKLCVEPDSIVAAGDKIGESLNGSSSVYSSISGVVGKTYSGNHPLLGEVTYVIIQSSTNELPKTESPRDIDTLTSDDVLKIAFDANIIDELDGQPLAQKLSKMQQKDPKTLIANAVEDQLYSSSAWCTLREDFMQVSSGLQLAAKCIGATDYKIASSMPMHYLKSRKNVLDPKMVMPLRSHLYPHDTLFDLGLEEFCIGPQACRALHRAAIYGEPQISMIVTVQGTGVLFPANVRIPIGTSLRLVLDMCGADVDATIVLGDNMTGTELHSVDVPMVPGMSCILCLTPTKEPNQTICINCGLCSRVCHKHLLPFEISRRYENKQYVNLRKLHPYACDGCNACTFVCPSGRNLAENVQNAAKEATVNVNNWEVHQYE